MCFSDGEQPQVMLLQRLLSTQPRLGRVRVRVGVGVRLRLRLRPRLRLRRRLRLSAPPHTMRWAASGLAAWRGGAGVVPHAAGRVSASAAPADRAPRD